MDPEHSLYTALDQYKWVFISYTMVSFLLREQYIIELIPTKISLILFIWSCTTQMQDLGKYLTNYETTGSTANILLNLKVIPKQKKNWTVKKD